MKTIFFLWVCSMLAACGFSGVGISPVLVCVSDEKGNPIPGAQVVIEDNGLDELIKRTLDQDSPFVRHARKADGSRRTDALGSAILYVAGGFLPDGRDGTITTVSGTAIVTAKGFQKKKVSFRREVRSKPKGQTSLVVSVSIELKSEDAE